MSKIEKSQKVLGLKYPIVSLSPMDGITDSPFRQIIKKYGNPDIIFTEFTHVQGLLMAPWNTLKHFYYEEVERPVIAQIYGQDPELFYHATKIVIALGFDGVDINMGCPAKKVRAAGSGAALIRTPDIAREIIFQVKRGVNDWVKDGKLTGMSNKAMKTVEANVTIFRNRLKK
ncbi:MAG: tRNA-dihydrouridine synthase family protein [Candidatus Dojkabacteria bacterium]|nr:tRNA-dihydrouridine synthase family protein [Candidatus Dojkabacteria bacterium]